jgi:hypothetical protein
MGQQEPRRVGCGTMYACIYVHGYKIKWNGVRRRLGTSTTIDMKFKMTLKMRQRGHMFDSLLSFSPLTVLIRDMTIEAFCV